MARARKSLGFGLRQSEMTKIAAVAEGESSTVDLYVRANIFDVFEIDFTANVFVFKGYLEVKRAFLTGFEVKLVFGSPIFLRWSQ